MLRPQRLIRGGFSQGSRIRNESQGRNGISLLCSNVDDRSGVTSNKFSLVPHTTSMVT